MRTVPQLGNLWVLYLYDEQIESVAYAFYLRRLGHEHSPGSYAAWGRSQLCNGLRRGPRREHGTFTPRQRWLALRCLAVFAIY